ncbi:MAG: hypothetical protein IJW16_03485 [Clostridia bacterium]|nr:hypothetical protein [Clostridia bacterium]
MTNKRSTKRALLTSIMSMLLCVAMLAGTTFAWFTDSVTSSNNVITSGNLDVTFEYWDDVAGDWADVEGKSSIFDPNALWEPGYTEVIYLKVANVGSLALKYQLGVNIVSETGSTNVLGNTFKLSDYIYFDVKEMSETEYARFADRAAAMAIATEKTKISAGYSKDSVLLAGNPAPTEYVALVVYMPEWVGNEANYDSKVAAAPQINLGLNVLATQYTKEADSFDEKYDKDAVYADAYVTNATELQKAIDELGAGENATIALMGDIDLSNASGAAMMSTAQPAYGLIIPAGVEVKLDLNGYAVKFGTDVAAATAVINNKGILIIEDSVGTGLIELTGATVDTTYGYATDTILNNGMLTVNGGTIKNSNKGASYAIDNNVGATTVVNGGKIMNTAGEAIRAYSWSETEASTLVINGGDVRGTMAVRISNLTTNLACKIDVTINGGTFTGINNGWALFSYCNNGSNVNVALNGGNFYGWVGFGGGNKTGTEKVLVNFDKCEFYVGIGRYMAGDEWVSILEGDLAGTVASNEEDLTEALASGTKVVLTNDVKSEAATTAPYGNKYAYKLDGGVLDGNNNELYMECYGDDYGIMTSGGTVKNITITEGCRAIMLMYATEDVILDNVNIGGDGVLYPINTGEGGTPENVNLIVTNSTLAGWTSYGLINSASFTNVKFEQGTYYNNIYGRVLKPYVNTTLTDCSFVKHMNLDLSSLVAGNKIVMENCTVGGQAVTADVFTVPTNDEEYDTELFTVDLPAWASSIADCIVIK